MNAYEAACAETSAHMAVVRCAEAYVACMREFTDTAAGNLSNCCAEHYQALDEAVERYAAARAAFESLEAQ